MSSAPRGSNSAKCSASTQTWSGNDVAAELAQLQADVPADPPGSAESTITGELGVNVCDAFGTFEATPMASASVAQAHRASLKDGAHAGSSRICGEVRRGPRRLLAHRGGGRVDTMMRAAIDLGQELAKLQLLAAR